MKKTLLATVLALGALTLSACEIEGDEGEDALAAPTGTSTSATYAAPPVAQISDEEIAEQAFLSTIRGRGVSIPTDTALLAGLASCEFIDTGGDVEDLFFEMAMDPTAQVLPDVPNEDLPHIIGAAVGALCPEFQGEFK